MALRLDLMALESPSRFQAMCFRLARRRFPNATPINFASWDQGCDIIEFSPSSGRGDVVWQCKFTRDLGAATRRAVQNSVESLDKHRTAGRPSRRKIARWILCLPVDPTGVFLAWLRQALVGRSTKVEVWGKTELLLMLEKNPDILESFFYEVYAELRAHFRTDELELVRLKLDRGSEWRKPDLNILHFVPKANVTSADFALDIVVRNIGTVETMLTGLLAEVSDTIRVFHGLPRKGFLLPKIAYKISLRHGAPGAYTREFGKLLRIKPGALARFKLRLVDTGYAWTGCVRLGLRYGKSGTLYLPRLRLST
jgi:hypothetical protein